MVEPLIINQARLESITNETGLYIVGSSDNASFTPSLPSIFDRNSDGAGPRRSNDVVVDCNSLNKVFTGGDIVWLDGPRSIVKSVLSRRSTANTLLVTEQCDNRCSFCSQPPNSLPDAELYHRATLALLNFPTDSFIGISGGEPTLNRHCFSAMLRVTHENKCHTPLHILTNGRHFKDQKFIAGIRNHIEGRNILWGIPLYGHHSKLHDQLVKAKGAFRETFEGLLTLGRLGQSIELRIIPVRDNIEYLPLIVEMVAHSFPFVTMISVMNLEPKGWARKNYQNLHVPVKAQTPFLKQCREICNLHNIQLNLFNYPLCLISESLWENACKSISDWKNYYVSQCTSCSMINQCGGFFTSANGQFIENVEPII